MTGNCIVSEAEQSKGTFAFVTNLCWLCRNKPVSCIWSNAYQIKMNECVWKNSETAIKLMGVPAERGLAKAGLTALMQACASV